MPPSNYDFLLGMVVRELREERGLTTRELSADVGMAPNFISRVENGERSLSLALIARVAEALDTKPLVLLRRVYLSAD